MKLDDQNGNEHWYCIEEIESVFAESTEHGWEVTIQSLGATSLICLSERQYQKLINYVNKFTEYQWGNK